MLLITSVLSLLCTARYTVVSNVDLDLKNEPVMNKSSIFGFRNKETTQNIQWALNIIYFSENYLSGMNLNICTSYKKCLTLSNTIDVGQNFLSKKVLRS